ncbi:hypothetical protein [Acinetobacter guillouiae]|nr:hypothetical protein [Acinetobacter guillouiae]MDO6645559.1 hypothetical protein [Acinetobacter guillouiae]
MKRMIFGLMINSIFIISWAACSYDFDATQTQIQFTYPVGTTDICGNTI